MTVSTLKIGRREYVVVPRRDFNRITAQACEQVRQRAQDAGDAAESRRRMREPGGISLAELRRKLGL
jgi:hypothetical protein